MIAPQKSDLPDPGQRGSGSGNISGGVSMKILANKKTGGAYWHYYYSNYLGRDVSALGDCLRQCGCYGQG